MGRALILLLCGCVTPAATECSALMPCTSGGYKFCKQGAACYYSLSDGSTVCCTDCGDCAAAVQRVTDWCEPQPATPDMAFQTSGLTIPKMGPPYTGTQADAGMHAPAAR